MTDRRLLVFFDGKCPFCVGWVKFLIDRDGADRFRFAALQSEWTREFLSEKGLPQPGTGSILVWDGRELLRQSEAIARLAAALPGIWRLLSVIRYFPRRMRDGLYDFIGERRYRWFGQYKACWLPEDAEKRKFLDLEDPVYKDTGHAD